MSAVGEVREPSGRYLVDLASPPIRHFDLLATAALGVTRLRDLILSLAVRGRLSASEETTASMPAGAANVPCSLPPGWQWTRLSELGEFRGGKTPSTQRSDYWDGTIPWITPKDMKQLRLSDSQDHVTPKALEDGLALIPAGSLLIVVRSGILRRTVPTAINDVQTTINQDLKALVFLNPELAPYVQLLVRGFDDFIRQNLTKIGTTVESIQFDAFASQPFPLPPLAEQARIVARVDELMRLCDALEEKGRLEAEQHARLLSTLLGTLTDSATPEELAANWQRVAEHFELLLDRPEAVDALDRAILYLAVRGLLVAQDPREAPASTLTRLLRERNGQRAAPVLEGDAPFPLPGSWSWVRFDELIDPTRPISYGVLVPGPDVADGVPLVRIADLSLTDPPRLPEKRIGAAVDAQFARTRLEGDEILMGVVGSIGKLGVAPSTWAGANIARAVCRIVPAEGVNREFVLLLLQSEFMQTNFAGDTRTLAQPTLNVGLIRSSPTPLPPVAEQARIVTRVTELRRLCATLRERLQAQQATQSRLAEALVEQATA